MHDYKIQVTLTPVQVRLILKAMDLYVGLGLGRLEDAAETVNHLFGRDAGPFDADDLVNAKMDEIKVDVLGLSRKGNLGIGHPDVLSEVKTLYDAAKCIQKGVAVAEGHERFSVWHDGDLVHYGTEPSAKIDLVRHGEVVPVVVDRHSWRGSNG